jgi:hypothetical protein
MPVPWLNAVDSTDAVKDVDEVNMPYEEPSTPKQLCGEQADMTDPQATLVKSLTDLETDNCFRMSNPNCVDESLLSPNVADFRPKRRIRPPARYRDE